ncbi:carboxy-S-adenosyl-L-methionine synthase CmoA [Thalassotalea sp. G2M2-11]|uniref:carboxy-S-adenosyl-L-methionine synthase CmoA n=1 Tax=Thalassotalea sp. G2M2-11 TaxID=2787627 RepID=UPI0019D27EBE|nr:carboxy-S-adenosyl-L-methionine synthase CmoA [Thalassotalea sp. G2M2-11]
MPRSNTDVIFSNKQSKIKDFAFDAQVAEVFPDMISRSVPGYATIIDTIGQLSQHYVSEGSNVYDLGCSLGAATLAMRQAITAKQCKIIGVDNSTAMVERCQRHVNAFKGDTPVEIIEDNILNVEMNNASMAVLNFTLQFIEPDLRQTMINNVAQGLNTGGILVLSEKISSTDDVCDDLLIDLHHNFKRANGYSDLEIAQKRTALENVMRTDDLPTHISRLETAGFTHISPWFQCFNFFSLVAIK